ncbi:MAG: hypothetical protein HYS74_02630 [Parcubacteria group bacterium]|nr:hypothetical protein [Parcubacteria group bacterium]
MRSWAAQRRLVYFLLIAGFLAALFSVPLFSYFNRPASCTDGIQNQGEEGIDCGGPCSAVCESRVADLVVLWSRFARVGDGVYDAVALVENPNPLAGLPQFAYSFKLYDAENILIAERRGETFANPNEQFAVYEPRIGTGARVPQRIFFTAEGETGWRTAAVEKPTIAVRNQRMDDRDGKPRLTATLANQSLVDARGITVVALLFDARETVIAVGKTEVDLLPRESERGITFLWPAPFSERPVRIDIIPRLNVTVSRL